VVAGRAPSAVGPLGAPAVRGFRAGRDPGSCRLPLRRMGPDDASTDPQPGAGTADATARALGGVRPVDLRDYADCRPGAATRTRVFQTASLGVDLWCIEPRSSTGVLHLPDEDVAYTVIGGRSWFVTDEGEVGLDPMGAVLVPADTVHGIDNRAPDPLIVLAASSPPGPVGEDAPVGDDAEAITWARTQPGVVRRAVETVLGVGRREG
jgi:quercetin dioxygenase-like cupin family protein